MQGKGWQTHVHGVPDQYFADVPEQRPGMSADPPLCVGHRVFAHCILVNKRKECEAPAYHSQYGNRLLLLLLLLLLLTACTRASIAARPSDAALCCM